MINVNPTIQTGNKGTQRSPRGMRAPLATFQYIVMHAIQRLGNEAYGVAIEDYITNELPQLRFNIDGAQIYITTKRLVDCGYLTFHEAPAPSGRGHTVKMYRVSKKGLRALREAAAFFAAVAKLEEDNSHGERQAPPKGARNRHAIARTRTS